MSRCIIHVGMHKTGTTSIQSSLNKFADEHFLYANLGPVANHSAAIHSLFCEAPEDYQVNRSRGLSGAALESYLAEMRTALDKAIEAAGKRTLVISGEDISSLAESELRGLHAYLKKHFEVITIVAYVRPPYGFIISAFQQRLKAGVVREFNINNEYKSYQQRFEKFDKIFGQDNVRLFKFDSKVFPDGCVVQDFCTRLGIRLPASKIIRLNESLSRQTVALLYTYRKFEHIFQARRLKPAIVMQFNKLISTEIGDDKFRISPEVVLPVLEKKRDDIAWMESRLGQSLNENLGKCQAGDICQETDLLNFGSELVEKLQRLLGTRRPVDGNGRNPEDVAQLVHALLVSRNLQVDSKRNNAVPEGDAAFVRATPGNKKICYLHLGTGKTGTSSIQYALTVQKDYLIGKGYFYPDVSNNFKHVLAGNPTAGNGAAIFKALKSKTVEEAIQLLEPFFQQEGNLILSCEGFWQVPTDRLTTFVKSLESFGYQVKGLIVFRPQSEMMVSSFLQKIKTDKTEDFSSLAQFAERQLEVMAKPQNRWNWFACAKRMENIFAEGNLTVHWYPALLRDGNQGIVEAFFNWLGVAISSDFGTSRKELVNPTPGLEAMKILELMNEQGFGGKDFSDKFLMRCQADGVLGRKVTMAPALAQNVNAMTHEWNLQLLKRYLPQLHANEELKIRLPIGEAENPDPKVVATAMRIAAEVLSETQNK